MEVEQTGTYYKEYLRATFLDCKADVLIQRVIYTT